MGFPKINRTSNLLLKTGIVVMFVSLLLAGLYLVLNSIKKGVPAKETTTVVSKTPSATPEQIESWDTYRNSDYGFSVNYPKLLYKREIAGNERYNFFIVFEENVYSKSKGIAVGVSKNDLKKEADLIKSEIKNDSGDDPSKEKDLVFLGQKSIRLDYLINKQNEESKVIYIINKGSYTYSVSTIPEQIDKVMYDFKFIDIVTPTKAASIKK